MILIEHHVMVKVNNTSRFFRDKIEIFSNLVVRDEIEICFFYISCFETRSRICFTTSRISRRGRETKQLILEVEREFSMLILARHFEIENSRQCLSSALSWAISNVIISMLFLSIFITWPYHTQTAISSPQISFSSWISCNCNYDQHNHDHLHVQP